MWSLRLFGQVLAIVLAPAPGLLSPVSTNFNASLRDYSVKEPDLKGSDNVGNLTGLDYGYWQSVAWRSPGMCRFPHDVYVNSTVRTMQQEEFGRYANFAPVRNPVRFKEIPDNAISSSSYHRGLLHDHGGGGYSHDYDDGHYGYGFEYDHGLNHHLGDHHVVGHHLPGHHLAGHHGHHLGHGHHHKHYDHALVAKTILWPLAGLALLGTAAALVSNPVLLQLGVISGRRRRDTEEVDTFNFKKWKNNVAAIDHKKNEENSAKRRVFKDAQRRNKKAYQKEQSTIGGVTLEEQEYSKLDDDKFVPVAIKVRN